MRKYLRTLCIVTVIFMSFMPTAKANFGDLRFEVTNVSLNESKIRFEGWAFIHRTNNFRTVYKNADPSNEILASDGGQEIQIRAYKNNEATAFDTVTNADANYTNPKYNFYYEHFYKDGRSIGDTYNGGLASNTCYYNSGYCYYQDMAFNIEFDTKSPAWSNITASDTISFKIAVTNKSYRNNKATSEPYWKEDYIYAYPENVDSAGNNFIKINKNVLTDVVKMIVINGRWIESDNNGTFKSVSVYGANGQYYKMVSATKNKSTPIWSQYGTIGQRIIELYTTPNYYDCTYSGLAGDHEGCYNGTCANGNANSCNLSNVNKRYIYSSYVQPTGRLEINVKEDKKCPVSAPTIDKLQCNNTGTINSTCNELTVSYNGSTADVKVEETGVITNLLTPTKIFDGGGFHMGIMYYNTLKWSCVSGNCDNNIKEAMNQKLKTIDNFKSGINLDNVVFNGKSIDRGLFIKNCNQNGTFANGNTLTTVCTFFLPKSTKDYNGKILYGQGTDYGINNKYYTDLNYSGDYPISFDIVGMDRLTPTSVVKDSKNNGRAWTGNWKLSFNNCNIKVYRRLYNDPEPESGGNDPQGTPPGKVLSYKYIYRPIDVTNPFPRHYAGLNWRKWYYESSSNRERIANSYDSSKLEYKIELTAKNISEIQNYNRLHNYGDWYKIDEVTKESDFVEKYNMRVGD